MISLSFKGKIINRKSLESSSLAGLHEGAKWNRFYFDSRLYPYIYTGCLEKYHRFHHFIFCIKWPHFKGWSLQILSDIIHFFIQTSLPWWIYSQSYQSLIKVKGRSLWHCKVYVEKCCECTDWASPDACTLPVRTCALAVFSWRPKAADMFPPFFLFVPHDQSCCCAATSFDA